MGGGAFKRSIILDSFRNGDKVGFHDHVERLRRASDSIHWFDFADTLADWARLAIRARQHLVGVARNRIR
jgi:hypothetical protein